ncbi:t-SNARE [Rhizophagus irregularis DAOM 181602=DAOM 197198]|uniref:t-SNARE n=1 Tax=Rhizophagus irregularis (strain DAOM 181602 / DAOM 197198 / MUCL 43194) TaxID=747089 RepID=A0A2P4P2I2_RHIID|nr:t-SNARE [Rhizophagus irregularis DAOM 181602=DAOM 197198]POG59568.1 t-SNARE [Rhizophagus irregularis DAOM 181602=DAOM 197198]|eukprot:XP_025166434.1 t-SNARE [Rhizophagus irregularis DAOM 181602=DAOM 197198]
MSNINEFLNETIEIGQKLTNAKSNITKIQELQAQLLDNHISTIKEDLLNKERENFVSNTRNLLIECRDQIKRIQYENAHVPSSDPNFGPRQQKYEYLRTKLCNVLEDYRQVESDFMKRTKDCMTKQYKTWNPKATQPEIDYYISNSDSQLISLLALLKINGIKGAKQVLAELQKRNEYIKNIEYTVAELAALSRDFHEFHEQNVQDVGNDYCVLS